MPFEGKTITSPMNCRIQICDRGDDVKCSSTTRPSSGEARVQLHQMVCNSSLPALLEKNGDYMEPDEEVLTLLNMDFCGWLLLFTVSRPWIAVL